jgi:hypothetical protein
MELHLFRTALKGQVISWVAVVGHIVPESLIAVASSALSFRYIHHRTQRSFVVHFW